MGGVTVLVVFFIILAVRRARGEPTQLPPTFWLWCWKYVQLIVLLAVFGTTDLVGKALVAPAFILLFAPLFTLTRIVVPLGLPRLAYWVARCCGPVKLMRESGAGAAVYGALALARRPSSTKAIDWLERKVNGARSMRGAGVVAAGLLAALRGDQQRARCLLLIADTSHRKFIPAGVRAVARDWLVADAARIGNWPEVVRLGRRGRDSLRWSYALARIGERLAGDPRACHDWQLWLWWMVAPRRRASFQLLRRALAVTRRPEQTSAEPSVPGNLPDALAGLAHAIEGRFVHRRGLLARSLGEVDAVLELSAMRALLQQRLQDLAAPDDTEAVMSGLRKRVIELVVPLIEDSPRLAHGESHGSILDQAIAQARARLFSDIEARCSDYNDRQESESSLTSRSEWEAWAVMRNQAERLLELAPESESALFHTMYVPTCNFAVFQHNRCGRRFLAHEMYSWLHLHAGDDRAATQLLLKNMWASLA